METTVRRIAGELGVSEECIEAALRLLGEGHTSPFLARFRKEFTGGLDISQLRAIEERLQQVRELDERRSFILKSLGEQGRLTPELQTAIATAESRARLEDLYLPLKQKKRSRANIARDSGLEPLADALLADHELVPDQVAEPYVNAEKGVPDKLAALDGARWILLERFSEDPELLDQIRHHVADHATLQARVVEGRQEKGAKFSEFFAFAEPVKSIAAHRALALFRGRKEGILRLVLTLPAPAASVAADATPPVSAEAVPPAEAPLADAPAVEEAAEAAEVAEVESAPAAAAPADAPAPRPEPVRESPSVPEQMIAERFGVRHEGCAADGWLTDTVRRAWKMKVFPYVQVEIEGMLRERAEREAIHQYARSLSDLLMAAPAGPRIVMGLDPGLRTGVKAAVVDAAGNLLEHATVFPHQPKNEWDQAIETLGGLIERHAVELVAVGNGTGSRETDRLLSDIARRRPELRFSKVIVSEAGASAYASSRLAARELPGLEVPLRAAVSVARRLQDPLAELVKVEPRTIGVGQYQHDVNQAHLSRALGSVIENCVNEVGVDLNTASSALLGRVAGLNHRVADNVVAVRSTTGPFRSREDLRKVPGISDRIYEQAAGFIRVAGGEQLLDATRVHPEAYGVVERIASAAGCSVPELIGNEEVLARIAVDQFADEQFGESTVADIISELRSPACDPRPPFRLATFKEGLDDLADLRPGMILEGVVTNVATFGAFVDVGVHQDGLVHVSRLADRFVKDPHEVVRAGDIVKVKVLEVDLERKRVALTMRFDKKPVPGAARGSAPRPSRDAAGKQAQRKRPPQTAPPAKAPVADTAMAAAFSRLLKRG
jgi:protein Tex